MLNLEKIDLTVSGLLKHYRAGDFSPAQLIAALLEKADSIEHNPIWISRLSSEQLQPYLTTLERADIDSLPLYGIPFAIKDNIDLAGVATTAACPEFSYVPESSASVVTNLIAAGAIPLGKTNMDQFATGLVGVRSPEPWGPCKNALNDTIISGGSSSGSAVAVALGLVSFSLGTDTAGSGRVPASLNNLVGLKPTRGLLSCKGVVPACKSLDCVSIFAFNCDDANHVFDCAMSFDQADAYSRKTAYSNSKRYYHAQQKQLRLGVPSKESLEFFACDEAHTLYTQFLENLPPDIETCEIDLAPFLQAAKLLYEGPWVAERYLATQKLIESAPDALLPVIKTIIGNGNKPLALDAFASNYKLQKFKQLADQQLANVDAILTPTNPRYFSITEVEQDPIALNSKMGYYTNFMNLLDYAAIAIPIGFFKNGVGYGVTLFSHAQHDKHLLSIAAQLQNIQQLNYGAFGQAFKTQGNTALAEPYQTIEVAVCGAHLEGLPLNWQLLERGAQKLTSTTTSPNYRLYALPGGPPHRPALVRDNESGAAIALETWRLPAAEFGSFVNEIPAPLGIGKVQLNDDSWVSGFICDNWGIAGAKDITEFGGWKAFLKTL